MSRDSVNLLKAKMLISKSDTVMTRNGPPHFGDVMLSHLQNIISVTSRWIITVIKCLDINFDMHISLGEEADPFRFYATPSTNGTPFYK